MDRAQTFLQFERGERLYPPRLSLQMVLIINAIIFVRSLEARWPRRRHHRRHDAVPHLNLASLLQRQVINLLLTLDFVRYSNMLRDIHNVSDKDLEVLRMFTLLVHELEAAVGRLAADPMHALFLYYYRSIDRAIVASRAVLRMLTVMEKGLLARMAQVEGLEGNDGQPAASFVQSKDAVSSVFRICLLSTSVIGIF
ncbi:hypothetical protein VUR80DRAFT_3315 [Thermomyces stellatus]